MWRCPRHGLRRCAKSDRSGGHETASAGALLKGIGEVIAGGDSRNLVQAGPSAWCVSVIEAPSNWAFGGARRTSLQSGRGLRTKAAYGWAHTLSWRPATTHCFL